jgi:hypothetical protein
MEKQILTAVTPNSNSWRLISQIVRMTSEIPGSRPRLLQCYIYSRLEIAVDNEPLVVPSRVQ